MRFLILAVLGSWFAGVRAEAQVERFEMGLRVQDLEEVWAREREPGRRELALPHIQTGVSKFFAADWPDVARNFDRARRTLLGEDRELWADSLSVLPIERVVDPQVDASKPELNFRVSRFYGEYELPNSSTLEVWTQPRDGSQRKRLARWSPVKIETILNVPLASVGPTPRDLSLELRLLENDRLLRVWDDVVSLIPRIEKTTQELRSKLDSLPGRSPGISQKPTGRSSARATARALLDRIESMGQGFVFEQPFRAAAALDCVRSILNESKAGESTQVSLRPLLSPGDHWLVLASRAHLTPTRWWIPEGLSKGERRPLVIAVHGVGGSENLFMEGHGGGAIVDLCRRRGWFLLCPRRTLLGSAPVGDLLEAALKLLPVDSTRVFVIGHSMGAAQAADAAFTEPARYAAIAGLGGGARTQPGSDISKLPFFIAAGDLDFGRGGAARLARRLKSRSAKVTYRIYPRCEHMMIVGEALPDVFRFFDEVLGAPNER